MPLIRLSCYGFMDSIYIYSANIYSDFKICVCFYVDYMLLLFTKKKKIKLIFSKNIAEIVFFVLSMCIDFRVQKIKLVFPFKATLIRMY